MRAQINRRPRNKVQNGRRQVYVPMLGGIDVVTQDLRRTPGTASIAVNFEPGIEDGFHRIDGYERIDGHAAPTAAEWHVVRLTDASDRAIGETLYGDAGGIGTIIFIDGDQLVITAFNGVSFVIGEVTSGDGLVVAPEAALAASDNYTEIELELVAQNYYRDMISALPGTGDALGVWVHLENIYAFRNNEAGTAALLYRATEDGWEVVPLFHALRYDAGTAAFVYGEAITSSGTGVGVVKKVILNNGTHWDDLDGTGTLIVQVTAGSFLDNETLTGGTDGAAVAAGDASAISLLPNGRYEFISHNFYAQNATYYIYGCDGVNPAFEIDSNHVYTPILTASVPDTPKYIAAHKLHLWLAVGASLIQSEPGVPYGFDGAFGAGEHAVGAPVTGIKTQPGEVMSVSTLRQIWGVYGSSVDDFRLDLISSDAGAYDYSFVTLGFPFGINDQGIVAQQRVSAYGNFEAATISRYIQPLIDAKKLMLTAASVVRKRNQIRFYFSDKSALVVALSMGQNGMAARATTLELSHVVKCICNAPDTTGQERILFGSDDGMIYEMEKGFSFDGGAIEYYLRANHWTPIPNIMQKFHLFGITVQIRSTGRFSMQATYELSFGHADNAPTSARNKDVAGSGAYYDVDFYDESYYDSAYVQQIGFPFTGDGNSANISLYGNNALTKGFTVEGMTFDFSPRGVTRGY